MKRLGEISKYLAVMLIAAFMIMPSSSSHLQSGRMPDAAGNLLAAYATLPLSFEANQGQTDGSVKFLSRGRGYALFLTGDEAVLSLRKARDPEPGPKPPTRRSSMHPSMPSVKPIEDAAVLEMKLIGGNPAPPATGLEELPGRSNYLIGKDPRRWRVNVPNYAKVRFADVYPGVDLVYYGNQSQLEYDFVVSPGADPSAIALGFAGAQRLEIDPQGDLALHSPIGGVRWHKPVVYQEIGGIRKIVDASYWRKGDEAVGFALGSYDPRHALVIDPTLDYSTYLGGSGPESGKGIAVDSAGNAYVTGSTFSTNFPVSAGALQSDIGAVIGFGPTGTDAFVTKFDTTQFDTATRVYSTYLGGGLADIGTSIAVDSSGKAYVTGTTDSNDFPVTGSAYQTTISPPFDRPNSIFVTKLNAAGTALEYSTFLGGNGDELGRGIAVDSSNPPDGYAYVTGTTFSSDFPTLHGFSGNGANYVAKLNTLASGVSSLLYSTYTGGLSVTGIAADPSGNVYMTGQWSCDPVGGIINPPCPAGTLTQVDAFVAKIDTTAVGLTSAVYSLIFGGSGNDESGGGIALDSSVPPNIYISGYTNSLADFPGASSSPIQATNGGGRDAFVAKVNGATRGLVWSTYLGGSGDDASGPIAVDALGNVYVAGTTSSTSGFPLVNAFQSSLQGTSDVFVAKINAAGTALSYSSYLGGHNSDSVAGIAVDSFGNAYVGGDTGSNDFPLVNAFQTSYGGARDAFVAKIHDSAPPAPAISLSPTSLSFTATAGEANPADQTVSISNSGGGTLNWTASVVTGASWLSVVPGSGTDTGTLTVSANIAGLVPDTYNGSIEVIGAGASNTPQTIAVQLTITAATLPTLSLDWTSLVFTATAGGANPEDQADSISNSGGGTLSWTASVLPGASWLSVVPGSGTDTGTLWISVNIAGLTPNTYNGSIEVAGPGASNTPQIIAVQLIVTAPPQPTISLNPTSLSFTATAGGTNPGAQSFSISNSGFGTLNWTATVVSGSSWLYVSSASGTDSDSIVVYVDITGLAANTYNGSIQVTGTGATNTPQTIPVQLTVTPAPQPTISLSRTSLSFTATSGGANPANQAVSISNSGGGTLNWTASVVPGASWLGVVPGSGTDAGTLTVSANITGLAPNTYNGSIQVTGTGATNTPQTIPVQLTVTPAPTPPPPTISDLISLVSGLPDGGVRLFLLARLHNIQALIDRGSTRAACSNLDAFVKDVQLLGKIGRIDPATAEELIHAARAIQASLGCR